MESKARGWGGPGLSKVTHELPVGELHRANSGREHNGAELAREMLGPPARVSPATGLDPWGSFLKPPKPSIPRPNIQRPFSHNRKQMKLSNCIGYISTIPKESSKVACTLPSLNLLL